MLFGGLQSLCLLNCLRSKNTLKQGKGFEFLKLTAEPIFLENLKRSCKKLWKVMEFEEHFKSINPVVVLILKCLVTFDDLGQCN